MCPSTTTVFAGVPRSDMLEAYVRVRACALAQEFPMVLTCRVAVEAPDQQSPRHVRLAVATATDAIFAGATVGLGVRSGDLYMLVDRAFERLHAQLSLRVRRGIERLSGVDTSQRPSLCKTHGAPHFELVLAEPLSE